MKNLFICLLLISFSTLLFSKTDRKILPGKNISIQEKLNKPNSKNYSVKKGIKFKELDPKFLKELTASRADSIITITVYDTSMYRFWYDAVGNVATYYRYLKSNDKWAKDYGNSYTYTASGKVKTNVSYFGTNDNWQPSYRYTNTYDEKENLTLKYVEYNDSTGWRDDEIDTYTWTPNGLMLSWFTKRWENGAMQNSTRLECKYDNNWNLISRSAEHWEAGAWTFSYLLLFSYNQYGDLVEQVSDYWDLWTDTRIKSRETNTYNSKRQITQEMEERYSDSKWNNFSRKTHVYEANDLVHKRIYEYWNDTAWINSDFEIDTLDQNKRLIAFYYYYWEGGIWNTYYREHYKYNAKGNIFYFFSEFFGDNQWDKYAMEDYIYDETGELLFNYNLTTWENGVPMSPPVYGSYIYVNVDNNQFSSLYIAGYNINVWYKKVPVPVELSSFNASASNGFVLLKWQTATETNNKGFEIECKAGNNNWVTLGFVQGKGTTVNVNNYSFTYKPAVTGKCFYRLKQIDFDGTVNYSPEVEASSNIITSYSLNQNYPNPFNPSTSISFALPNESRVSLKIFNSVGQMVKELVSGVKPMGNYDVRFDASMLSSGVYFYSIEASSVNGNGSFRNTKKMILVK